MDVELVRHIHHAGVGRKRRACDPLALVKVGGEPMVAPPPDAVIGSEDYISLISFPGFDWDEFEAGMARSSGVDSVGRRPSR